jgi:3-methyladenine DNA glycosylase Tag
MRSFDEIFAIAAERKGGADALNAMLVPPSGASDLAAIPDDRWLSQSTKCIFNAGFNWKVVEAMWPGFEEAFHGFDLGQCAMLNDEDIARLASDKRIVRHGGKIRSVQENAVFFRELAKEHGSVGKFVAGWPDTDFTGLLALLKKRGSRLGGNTGQYFLRFMGKDSYVSVARCGRPLDRGGRHRQGAVIEIRHGGGAGAFNTWHEQSGRSLKEISRTLAMSTG